MTAKIQITDKTNKRTWAIIDGANAIDVSTDLQTVKSNTLKHFYPLDSITQSGPITLSNSLRRHLSSY